MLHIEKYIKFHDDTIEFGVDTMLQKFGIPVMDSEGNYRSIYDVLSDLSEVWDIDADLKGAGIHRE